MPRQSPLVVYVLGAGFSRPLGFPLVSDFLRRAADLFHGNRQEHQFLGDVLRDIAHLAAVKLCFASDLTNIEEVLSLIAMEDHLGRKGRTEAVQQFVARVVQDAGTSPTFPPNAPRSALEVVGSHPWGGYVGWVAHLLGIELRDVRSQVFPSTAGNAEDSVRFGVVSLNYDMVLETCESRLLSLWPVHKLPRLVTKFDAEGKWAPGVPYVKLHGSADEPATIVPMTWSKSIGRDAVGAWRAAYSLLRDATEIRFIGYSLPAGDSYIRFLLKSALAGNHQIRQIDVLALDPDGRVERRYRSFIRFPSFRFVDGDAFGYVLQYSEQTPREQGGAGAGLDADASRHEMALRSAIGTATNRRDSELPTRRRRRR